MIRKNLLAITPGRYRQKPEEEDEDDDDDDDEENKNSNSNSNNIPSPDLRPCRDDSWLQISCKLSLAHPVTQFWKHLAPDNSEYYHSSSAHVRTWLLGVLQTKRLAHTHTHGENNLQNNTHTINRRNISPTPSIRSQKKKTTKASWAATWPSDSPPPPDNTHHPLLLLLLLLLLLFFFSFFQILKPMTTKQNKNRPEQKQTRNDKKDTGITLFQRRL